MDVTRGHEARIRKVPIAGIREFINSDWQNASSSPIMRGEAKEELVEIKDSTFDKVEALPRWNSLLTLRRSWGLIRMVGQSLIMDIQHQMIAIGLFHG